MRARLLDRPHHVMKSVCRLCAALLLLFASCTTRVFATSAESLDARAQAGDMRVHGVVRDSGGLPLPGVTVTLVCTPRAPVKPGTTVPTVPTATSITSITSITAITSVTDEQGGYALAAAASADSAVSGSSRCTLTAQLPGFEPAMRDDVRIDAPGASSPIDLVLAVAGVKEGVTVQGEADTSPMGGGAAPARPSTVTREVIDHAVLPSGRVDDVLPLIPSVLRGPDGLISMAGARGTQSALLVNGGRETDPVTGEFGVDLPIESVDSIEVFPTGYAAEFGQATGSVARVRTRRGEDTLRASINSFDPRLRFDDGTTRGVEAWTPKLGVSGPIRKGRAWFAQALDYTLVLSPIDTRLGQQDTKVNALSSLSQIDWRASDRHDLTASIAASRQVIQGANLGAFTPVETRPRLQNGGWSLAVTDRYTLGPRALLESTLQVKRLRVRQEPAGEAPYVIGHDLTQGSYFNTQDREAWRTELTEQYTRASDGAHGANLWRAGLSIGYATFEGMNVSRPVTLLRSDGTPAQAFAFAGAGDLAASAWDLGLYAARRWRPSRWWSLDVGGRLDAAAGVTPVVSPRGEWSVTLPWDPRTTLKGGAGLFTDKLVLGARTFTRQQSRIVQAFDRDGAPIGPAIIYRNLFEGDLTLPKAWLWNVEANRELGRGFRLRLNYQQRAGVDELVVTPRPLTADRGLLALSSTGESRARGLETTIGFVDRPRGHQAYVSYVRSSARGNLNDLNAIEGNFKEPFVQDDQIGPLRFDAPHRLLAWGVVSLPRRTTVAPFVEWRSGFPYAVIDEEWRYVGARNGERFPRFFSLDVVVNKWIDLPWLHVPARIGFKIYNITAHENGRDVQADVERPDFDQTYNRIHRRLRGTFEIAWGKRR